MSVRRTVTEKRLIITSDEILGAMLYKSEKTAKSVIEKSVNFHSYPNNPYKIVGVELNEQE